MMQRPHHNRRQRLPRRGVLLVIALICLLIVSMIGMTVLRTAATQRRQTLREQLRIQADWLAEAGLERAAARWAADADYDGETWQIPASELDGRHAAVVRITLRPMKADPERRMVSITAEFPKDDVQRARSSKQALLGRDPR